jgi:hypothetical protein
MNLKKLLLLVFMYMIENKKEELNSSIGKLSIGGLIYIAKMAGLNNVGILMSQLKEVDLRLMKEDPTGEASSYWSGEIYEKILDEFKDEYDSESADMFNDIKLDGDEF